MDKEISKIIGNLNEEFGTDFTDDVKPLLQITLQNMKKGMNFDDAFKGALNSRIKSIARFDKGTKRRELANNIIIGRLCEKVAGGIYE